MRTNGARCLCGELYGRCNCTSADDTRTFALTFPNVSVLSTNKKSVVCFRLKRKETTMTGLITSLTRGGRHAAVIIKFVLDAKFAAERHFIRTVYNIVYYIRMSRAQAPNMHNASSIGAPSRARIDFVRKVDASASSTDAAKVDASVKVEVRAARRAAGCT